MTPKYSRRYLTLALAVALMLTLWVQIPHLLDPYAVEEDFRNHYWVYRYRDPDLFTNDLIEYKDTASPGYAMLFRVGTAFVPPILLSKILAFPLMLVAVYYVYRIVEQMAGRQAALIAGAGFAVFNLTTGTEVSVAMGLQRSCSVPLLAAFAYYLMGRRYGVAAIVIFITGTIYIPVLLVMVIAYILSCVRPRKEKSWRSIIDWRPISYLLVALLAVVVLLWPAFAQQADRALSASAGGAESVHILRDPTYTTGGRRALFVYFPIVGRGGLVSGIRAAAHLGVLLTMALVVRFVRGKAALRLPAAILRLLVASFIAFAFAWFAIVLTSSFFFHMPSRHTRYILFLSLVIYVFANAAETVEAGVYWLRRHRRQLAAVVAPVVIIALLIFLFVPSVQSDHYQDERWLPAARWLLLALVVVVTILTFHVVRRQANTNASDSSDRRGRWGRIVFGCGILLLSLFYLQLMNWRFYSPGEHERQLYSFLETLPKDILLAGDPCALDSVPLYAKRSVLFNCERFSHLPAETIGDALSAYYAAEWEEVYAFCREHNVTHLVVNAESYTEEVVNDEKYFFEPYTSQVADAIRSRPRYVLGELPAEERLFEAGAYSVVSCEDQGSVVEPAGRR